MKAQNSTVFGEAYANCYDILYQDKDYESECDFLELVFETCGVGEIRRVLDLGCGTGGHCLPLANRGYTVVGVDRSAEMLQQARCKARQHDVPVTFEQRDLCDFVSDGRFDAVILMFAVMSYQRTNDAVRAALAAARRNLRKDGLLVFDFWFGPAVLHLRPSQRMKKVQHNGLEIARMASPCLDRVEPVIHVDLHVCEMRQGRLIRETRERHTMRFFFPQEIMLLLRENRFQQLALCGFPELEAGPGEKDWTAVAVARAV